MNNPSKKGNISIVGIGRLGICTALILEKAGYDVIGVDVFQSYVDSINSKTLKTSEPLVEEYLKNSQNLKATMFLDEAINHSDIIYILVATPTGSGDKSYDHSHLSKVLHDLNKRKLKNKHIIIGCTVLPGYINNVARSIICDCENTTINYNPEFIAQGSIIKNFESPDIVLIGEETNESGNVIENIYKNIYSGLDQSRQPKYCRMSAESAEITKLSINCFITTKIAFANTIKDIADKTPNANAKDILSAVGGDLRIGSKCLIPGYGFGGPCFPRDNRALGNYAKSIGIEPIIPNATDASNKFHAENMANDMSNVEVLVFEDVTYKDNCPVPIIEESQKLEVAKLLAKRGRKVIIKDRKEIIDAVKLEYGNMFHYQYTS